MRETLASKKQNASKSARSKTVKNDELDRKIEEAIVDAYGDSERTAGFCTMLEDNFAIPSETQTLGIGVTVNRIDVTHHKEIQS